MALDRTGKIKMYKEDKAYGFVKLDTGDEAFFHKSACSRNVTPRPGDRVRCEVENTDRGLKVTSMAFE